MATLQEEDTSFHLVLFGLVSPMKQRGFYLGFQSSGAIAEHPVPLCILKSSEGIKSCVDETQFHVPPAVFPGPAQNYNSFICTNLTVIKSYFVVSHGENELNCAGSCYSPLETRFTSHFFSSAGREAALGASQGSGLDPEPQGTCAPLTFVYLMRRLLTLTRWRDGEKLLHKMLRAYQVWFPKVTYFSPWICGEFKDFPSELSKLVPEAGWL